ncbi:MAG: outer membrane beta-barrel protein [Pseudomonadota bacterium]
MKLALPALLMLASAPTAVAQEWYTGVGYTYYSPDDVSFNTVTTRIGYNPTQINDYVGFELEGLFGIGDDSIGAGAEQSLDFSIGGFAVGRYPLTERIEVFGRVGYQFVEITTELFDAGAVTLESNDSEDGVAFGGGLNIILRGPNTLRVGYTYADATEAHLAEISYVYRFGAN